MLTPFTSDLGFWIILATILMTVGSYKLLTKQNADANNENSKQIRQLSEKMDSIGFEIKLEQARLHGNLEHLNEKINKIESDTAAVRAQGGFFSEAIAKMQVKLQALERGNGIHEND